MTIAVGLAFIATQTSRTQVNQAQVLAAPGTEAADIERSEVVQRQVVSASTEQIPVVPAEQMVAAEDVLRRFLGAGSLGARLRWVGAGGEAIVGLIRSPLAAPFPESRSISPLMAIPFRDGSGAVFPFDVDFQREEDPRPQTYRFELTGRTGEEPRLLGGPLADLLGGRLVEFLGAPQERGGTFDVVLEPIPRCFDSTVPGAEKKISFRLLAGEGNEVGKAYASKLSQVAELLYESESQLKWGTPLPASVDLSWNSREDPENPFVELVGIGRVGCWASHMSAAP